MRCGFGAMTLEKWKEEERSLEIEDPKTRREAEKNIFLKEEENNKKKKTNVI